MGVTFRVTREVFVTEPYPRRNLTLEERIKYGEFLGEIECNSQREALIEGAKILGLDTKSFTNRREDYSYGWESCDFTSIVDFTNKREDIDGNPIVEQIRQLCIITDRHFLENFFNAED